MLGIPASRVTRTATADTACSGSILAELGKLGYCSEYRQLPQLRRGRRDPQVEIYPDIAKRHGIQRGDWVTIATPNGSIRQRASVTEENRHRRQALRRKS